MVTSELVAALRSDLLAANYSVDALNDLWGSAATEALSRGQRVPAERVCERAVRTPLVTLATLFMLGRSVSDTDLSRALPTLGVAGARELGVIAVNRSMATAALDLRPYTVTDPVGTAHWWILSDLGELHREGPLAADHVLGVGGASLTLTSLMMPTPVGSVLDLGTGCGIQALHASRHATRVVATDISERALRLAALNASLNEISGIEFRHGSMFEPVAGERFDQIVSNPPFVITPRSAGVPEYEYRDAGRVGDDVVASVVAQCGQYLTPGGCAQLLGNWEYRTNADGLDRVRDWVNASRVPVDAWVIEREFSDPNEYAALWIRDGGTTDSAELDRLMNLWLDDFETRDVTGVGFGYLLLRRPRTNEPTLRRFERIHQPLDSRSSGLGVALAAGLQVHDTLVSLSDDELARACVLCATDVTEERYYTPGSDDPTVIHLRQGGSFGRVHSVDTALAALVGACDGDLSIGALCSALAELLDVDEERLIADLLPRVRELLDEGLLVLPARSLTLVAS